jgi:hypothetical protein
MPEPHPASREELLEYLEQLSGRSIRSRAELEAYLNELKTQAQAAPPSRRERGWAIAKHATLAVGLLIAVLQYYLIHIYVQMASLDHLQFLNPHAPAVRKSALEVIRLLS